MTSSRLDISTRLASVRASRGEKRILLEEATTTTTLPPPPPTTAKPRPVVVKKTPPTTAKPKPAAAKPAPKPAPAASSTTPVTNTSRPQPTGGGHASTQDGNASWYEAKYHADNPWICAHRTLPMGTVITVTAVASGKSITCEVGDRGPYGGNNRILDLSKYAFSQLANPSSGVIAVHLSW